mmetsp:Transcript_53362/g.85224  ORF Transcript_53362/g.85224 Transcript_53362/m.85224 type:complete len:293 (+) Transcript_53362:359-1237(+)
MMITMSNMTSMRRTSIRRHRRSRRDWLHVWWINLDRQFLLQFRLFAAFAILLLLLLMRSRSLFLLLWQFLVLAVLITGFRAISVLLLDVALDDKVSFDVFQILHLLLVIIIVLGQLRQSGLEHLHLILCILHAVFRQSVMLRVFISVNVRHVRLFAALLQRGALLAFRPLAIRDIDGRIHNGQRTGSASSSHAIMTATRNARVLSIAVCASSTSLIWRRATLVHGRHFAVRITARIVRFGRVHSTHFILAERQRVFEFLVTSSARFLLLHHEFARRLTTHIIQSSLALKYRH